MRLLLLFAVGLAASACSAPVLENRQAGAADEPETLVELRGVWLTNVDSDVMLSRDAIAEAMQFLADHHFNVVYPVVLNNATTTYPSATMESVTGVRIDPRYDGRDPLQEIVEEAAKHDIAVIPWFEFGFSSSYGLEAEGGPILTARPEWAARNRDGDLLNKNGFEWMNAYHPEVQQFVLDLVLEVAQTYDVDGVQGDDRLPAQPSEGGYSEVTQQLYRDDHDGRSPPRGHLDPDWLRWRADKLNGFARRMYDEVKAVDPSLQVSLSPSIYPWGLRNYLQDWPSWAAGEYADQIHPQVYRYDFQAYSSTLTSQSAAVLDLPHEIDDRVYPGVLMNVGDYVIPTDHLLEVVTHNRERGYRGEVFFFYEGLRKNDDELARALLSTVYAQPARLPFGD